MKGKNSQFKLSLHHWISGKIFRGGEWVPKPILTRILQFEQKLGVLYCLIDCEIALNRLSNCSETSDLLVYQTDRRPGKRIKGGYPLQFEKFELAFSRALICQIFVYFRINVNSQELLQPLAMFFITMIQRTTNYFLCRGRNLWRSAFP